MTGINAKNIKIITIKSIVTLRGVVNTPQEKTSIANKAKAVDGTSRIDNQLVIKKNK